MASSGNFATWHGGFQNKSDIDISEGGCRVTSGSGAFRALSTFVLPTNSGKWYVEVCATSNSGNTSYVGVVSEESPDLNDDGTSFNFGRSSGDKTVFFDITIGKIKTENSDSQTGLTTFSSANDIIGMVIDMDNDNVQFYGNGSALGTAQAFPDASQNYYIWCGGNNDKAKHINAGQDSTFGGAVSAGGNSDGNGFGDFKYTVPTDAKAICSANLSISSDIDPAGADGATDNPTTHFGVVTYTGNGTARTISGLGFQPDLIWAKRRSATTIRHYLVDSSRGFTKYLHSDGTFTQGTSSDGVTSANSDGFVIGGDLSYVNTNTDTYVAWCWKANGGTTSTNTSGTATSTVQANTKAGFSICLTDNYTAGTGVTIGHGLGKAPAFYIHKTTGDNSSGGASQNFTWHVYHKSLGATKAMFLDTNAGASTAIGYWNNTEPTSSVLSLGNLIAGNGQSLVYAWSEIEGYSKFGQYDANGSADGPFIYTGFRPKLVWIKMTVSGDHWGVWDTARGTENPIDNILTWSTENAESSNDYYRVDFLSNGFKLRDGNAQINHASYDPYIWGAWADVPFKYANAF